MDIFLVPLSYFVFLIALIRAIIALVNMLSIRALPAGILRSHPFISILIPARNEEQNIGMVLSDCLQLDYKEFELIVYDDDSTDNTASIVEQFAKKDSRIRLVCGKELPVGFTGKNNACNQLAGIAKGIFVVYFDADVRVGRNFLTNAICYMQTEKLALLSIFPQQLTKSLGEKFSVPLMNWILLSLLPLALVRQTSWSALSAANGQCMIYDAEILHQTAPYQKFSHERVEDIAISRYYKQIGKRITTLLGDESLRCRMYRSWHEATEGFSKNVFYFFGNSKAITLAFGILTTLAPIVVYYSSGLSPFLFYIAIEVCIRVFVSVASQQSVWNNVCWLIPQQFTFLVIITKAIIYHYNRKLQWKERNVSSY